jgi:hypothetical protein
VLEEPLVGLVLRRNLGQPNGCLDGFDLAEERPHAGERPKLAGIVLRGPSGASGCHGFDDTAGRVVHNREDEWAGHSGLGTPLHCKNVWIPFILHGKLPKI